MKKSECLSLVFSSVSLIISIFVLVGNFPTVRKLGLDLDYLGVIIGVLSFILMLLLGWNMFNAVELNRSMRILKVRTGVVQREVNDSRKFVENKIDRITSSVQRKEEYMMGSVDFVQGMIKMNEGCFYVGYRLFISSLRHFLCCDEDVSAGVEGCLRNLDACLSNFDESNAGNVQGIFDEDFFNAVNFIKESKAECFDASCIFCFMKMEEKREKFISRIMSEN